MYIAHTTYSRPATPTTCTATFAWRVTGFQVNSNNASRQPTRIVCARVSVP